MGLREQQILDLIRQYGSVTITKVIETLQVRPASAWNTIERLEHKKLIVYDGVTKAWKIGADTGSKYHRWDVSRGTLSFKPKKSKNTVL